MNELALQLGYFYHASIKGDICHFNWTERLFVLYYPIYRSKEIFGVCLLK